ncbi:hypothetical protein [Anaerococcus sp. HMSC075B03]|nr:hypothetical protein [Anaerococcus sp. HMSC075B03]
MLVEGKNIIQNISICPKEYEGMFFIREIRKVTAFAKEHEEEFVDKF